jgi:UMF1 family MFS transporter
MDFFATKTQAYFMGAMIGMVLGSAQALSRSLYSQMIPAGRESSFFGLYEISEKGTSWMGQLMFTIIVGATVFFSTGDPRLIVFLRDRKCLFCFSQIQRGQFTNQET